MAFKNILNIAAISFKSQWGDKANNLSRILEYMEAAARRGADIVVFPEMALCGYAMSFAQKLNTDQEYITRQTLLRNAESENGPAVNQLIEYAQKLNVYAFVGMPLLDAEKQIYNSVIVVGPKGLCGIYRKIHLPYNEPLWATPGNDPLVVKTPWGPIGVGICYDAYRFPELSRYYAAKGCRLYINCTARAFSSKAWFGNETLEITTVREGIFVASANLCGINGDNTFMGGSSIIGPSQHKSEPFYYAGQPFGTEGADEEQLILATIDLSLSNRALFERNPKTEKTNWRPDVYMRMLDDITRENSI